jgi:hypothetical protein
MNALLFGSVYDMQLQYPKQCHPVAQSIERVDGKQFIP